MRKSTLKMSITAALFGAAAVSGSAFALPPGCDAPPCGGGGGNGPPNGGEETAAQNLSVPTIMFGTAVGGLSCGTVESPSALVPPSGDPLTDYEVPGYYYVQKVHTWQAQCFYADAARVQGNWGDNLEGDAKLKVGSPIRVEIFLTNMDDYSPMTTLQGYTVIKLEPSELDRNSAYGHEAVAVGGALDDNPTDFGQASWLVHDSGITFSVLNTDTNVYAVPPGTNPTAEINATGKVVYGYNLRVGEPGPYRIQFTSSEPIEFTGVDAGGQIDAHNVYIDINVVTGGGKGKGQP
jgi:hypothetical protein